MTRSNGETTNELLPAPRVGLALCRELAAQLGPVNFRPRNVVAAVASASAAAPAHKFPPLCASYSIKFGLWLLPACARDLHLAFMAREAFENRVVVWICNVGYPGAPFFFRGPKSHPDGRRSSTLCAKRYHGIWNLREGGKHPRRKIQKNSGDA